MKRLVLVVLISLIGLSSCSPKPPDKSEIESIKASRLEVESLSIILGNMLFEYYVTVEGEESHE